MELVSSPQMNNKERAGPTSPAFLFWLVVSG